MALTTRQATRLEVWKKHPGPQHKAIHKLAQKFNADPEFQYKLHIAGTYIFLVQVPLAVACSIFLPHIWAVVSIVYLTVISLMANTQTEYGSVSAAEAAMHSEAARQGIASQVKFDYTAIERDIARLAGLQPGPDGQKLASTICARLNVQESQK